MNKSCECPSCGHKNDIAFSECPNCGIILIKYNLYIERKNLESEKEKIKISNDEIKEREKIVQNKLLEQEAERKKLEEDRIILEQKYKEFEKNNIYKINNDIPDEDQQSINIELLKKYGKTEKITTNVTFYLLQNFALVLGILLITIGFFKEPDIGGTINIHKLHIKESYYFFGGLTLIIVTIRSGINRIVESISGVQAAFTRGDR